MGRGATGGPRRGWGQANHAGPVPLWGEDYELKGLPRESVITTRLLVAQEMN